MRQLLDRRARIVVVSAIAMATLPSLAIAPVAASVIAKESGSAICKTDSHAREGFTARGGPRREPALKQTAIEVEPAAKSGTYFRATVPVFFHVVYAGNVGNVSNAAIHDQVAVLNNTFGGGEGGPNTGFKFKLVGIDRTKNKTFFNAGPETAAEVAMKTKLHKGGRETLNLYSTSGAGYLGWAYFPDLSDEDLYLDGVVMAWQSMRGVSDEFEGQYDQGETATHEVGHWLNLYHVFEGCQAPGDHVADTPAQSEPSSGCPAGKDSCPSKPGVDAIHNYMDYSYDTCYTKFSRGQTQRMQDAWNTLRADG